MVTLLSTERGGTELPAPVVKILANHLVNVVLMDANEVVVNESLVTHAYKSWKAMQGTEMPPTMAEKVRQWVSGSAPHPSAQDIAPWRWDKVPPPHPMLS